MNAFLDDDLSELEQRVRAKLFAGRPVASPSRLSEEEQKIARRLMGTVNADKLASARDGRRVRLPPIREWVEWWTVQRDYGPEMWRVDRIVNGHIEESFDGTDRDALEEMLTQFRRSNIQTKRFLRSCEGLPEKSFGTRKSFTDRYGRTGEMPRGI